jgi:hypothetical protein
VILLSSESSDSSSMSDDWLEAQFSASLSSGNSLSVTTGVMSACEEKSVNSRFRSVASDSETVPVRAAAAATLKSFFG